MKQSLLCVAILFLLPLVALAAFPTGWNYRVQIVVDYTKVSTDETDFPVLLTEVNFPSAIFDADGSYPAQADGGDLRFTSDSAGANRLACDIVTWTTDNDPANGVAQIWIEMTAISSANAADDTIWCWWNTSGSDTQPAADAQYGSEDAWSNSFLFVSHMEEASGALIDETSNSHDFAVKGSPTFQSTGQIGYGILYDASTEMHAMAYDVTFNQLSYLTIMAWHRPTAMTSDDWGRVFTFTNGTGSDCYHMGVVGSVGGNWDYAPACRWRRNNNSTYTLADTTNSMTLDTYYHLAYTWSVDTDVMSLYRNAVDTFLATAGAMDAAASADSLGIGGHPRSTTRGIKGQIDELHVSSVTRSLGWITTAYNNQSARALFATAGTPVYRGDVAAAGQMIIIKRGKRP